jgi:hypothetical protein
VTLVVLFSFVMRFLAALALLLSSSVFADEEVVKSSDVVILTERTFELETQVATGATTGDWLIEFYAPW